MSETLTTKEACQILKIDVQTLGRYARERRLKASKIGRSWIFKKDEVLKFFESNQND